MLSVKKYSCLLFVAVLLVFEAFPVMAAELSVKESKTKSGVINITVPYISGAAGGKRIDNLVNQTIFTYINLQLKQVLDEQEVKDFDAVHKDVSEVNDMQRYNSELVKYTNKRIASKNDTGKVTASWYVHNDYEVKTTKDTFFSLILKIKTYTGGPSDIITWKTMNFDLKDGRLLELKDLFEAEADYATRLQMLIGYQQMGRARLLHHIKGKELKTPEPVTITGQEAFYVDDHYNLGIILQMAGNDKSAGGMQIYDISLNDFADLIKL
ncbi:MAG: hypothetical protein IKZ43_10635 [Acidaminococcaceae bacterium]|nr:hypothetical protein [Acidaminococcaceae bacterium]